MSRPARPPLLALGLLDLKRSAHDGSRLIPSGHADVMHEYTADRTYPVLAFALARLQSAQDADLEIFNVGLHMHTGGARVRIEIRGGAADPECPIDVPKWDFNWQSGCDLAAPALFRADQELAVTCRRHAGGARRSRLGRGHQRRDVPRHPQRCCRLRLAGTSPPRYV